MNPIYDLPVFFVFVLFFAFKDFFFDVGHFFKAFIEFVTILLLFHVLSFWLEACRNLAPQPGMEPLPPALKGEILTTGPPGKASTALSQGIDSSCWC